MIHLRSIRSSGLLMLGLAAGPLRGQSHPATDSAAAARTSWQAAAEAFRDGDNQTAWQRALLASHQWPEQVEYQRGVAIAAARRRDPTSLIAALDRLTSFQAGGGMARDSSVAALRDRPAVARALGRLAKASAPIRRSTVAATIEDSTLFAEGLDADAATGTLYVASVHHRTIYAIGRDGRPRDLQLTRHQRIGAILGVRFDAARGVLWATTAGLAQSAGFAPADSSIAALLRIRPADGELLGRWDLPAGLPHVAGDLAIGPRGDVFVTDSRSPWLFQLAPGADTLIGRTDPLFRSLQGPAPSPDGRTLYLADYSHGLLRLDLSSGVTSRLAVPAGVTSLGVDGLILAGGALIGVQNGVSPARIVRFTLDGAGRRIVSAVTVDRHLPEADQPTIGTLLGKDYLYVANSQWDQYNDDGTRVPGRALGRTLILKLRIP